MIRSLRVGLVYKPSRVIVKSEKRPVLNIMVSWSVERLAVCGDNFIPPTLVTVISGLTFLV